MILKMFIELNNFTGREIMRGILAMGFLLFSVNVFAQTPPEPKSWFMDVLKRSQENGNSEPYLLRLLLPVAWDRSHFSTELYPRFMFGEDGGLFQELNTTFPLSAKVEKPSRGKDATLLSAMQAARADTILIVDAGQWRLRSRNKQGLQDIAAAPAAQSISSESVRAWLVKQLGYDGVVLDRRGDYLLVGSLVKFDKKEIQALLLKDSARTPIIESRKAEGAALAQLLRQDGSVAVFQVIVGAFREGIPVGTKVQVEKKEEG